MEKSPRPYDPLSRFMPKISSKNVEPRAIKNSITAILTTDSNSATSKTPHERVSSWTNEFDKLTQKNRSRRIRIRRQNDGRTILGDSGPHFCIKF